MASATDPSAAAGSSPVLAGRYLLGPVLGRGGAADVYRADDQLLSRAVAVKVLRESAEDPSSRDRFIHEARTLAQLSHVAIVTVLDAGFTDERPYLVLELVGGSTLEQVGGGVPLPLDRVGRIGAQVADALEHAHQAGVVHRDIKPSNVLIGADDQVKVADFGIARLIGDTVRHTQTGHAIGTAAYLSPEQVTGGDLSGAVDIYSLGLVLIEALTGERAYPGPPTEAALARLHRSPVVPRHVPDAWQRLLSAMTATAAAERPDAGTVAAALR
ncbi:MAG: pknB 3, partial [Nocardioides sp.]|nr:pknB 3 [Nocardioides sp.]